jgi:DNA mismatch endonuclease, patch repair protein
MHPLPYPHPTDSAVSGRMRKISRRDTRPERAVRSELHALGLRFRKDLPIRTPSRVVRPDVVFTRKRLALFIDGCFWHCCPIHGNSPRSNTDYWGPKLERNVIRDHLVDEALEESGWHVVRAWEHEEAAAVARRVAGLLLARGPKGHGGSH